MEIIPQKHLHNSISYLSFQPLQNGELIHLFLNRPQDLSGAEILPNPGRISKLLTLLPVEQRPVISTKQVHVTRTLILDRRTDLNQIFSDREADALFTNRDDVYLSVRVADCLPIYVYDPGRKVIGLIHAGWRGTLLGITKKALLLASVNLGLEPSACLVVLGPCIQVCCYQVSPEVAVLFPDETVRLVDNKFSLDISKANYLQLLGAGVKSDNIHQVNQCTCCNPDMYYSYRRTRNEKERMYAILGLR